MRLKILFLILFSFLFCCSNDSSKLPQISVDFSWPKDQKCFDERSPEIILENVPRSAKSFQIKMTDVTNSYDHGGGTVEFEGSNIIPQGALKGYKGPCPSYGAPRYQLTVKAVDENENVVAFGKKTKKFPPESE